MRASRVRAAGPRVALAVSGILMVSYGAAASRSGQPGQPGAIRVVAVESVAEAATFNLSVGRTRTFVVGDAGVVVHNTSPCASALHRRLAPSERTTARRAAADFRTANGYPVDETGMDWHDFGGHRGGELPDELRNPDLSSNIYDDTDVNDITNLEIVRARGYTDDELVQRVDGAFGRRRPAWVRHQVQDQIRWVDRQAQLNGMSRRAYANKIRKGGKMDGIWYVPMECPLACPFVP